MLASLPDPDPAALERSAELAARIRGLIAENGGAIAFDTYMQMALYEPALGYYAVGRSIFGRAGDFVTASEAGGIFAGCLARQCAEIMAVAGHDIVECGAGSGSFAVALIEALLGLGIKPSRYLIVEPSVELAAQQRARLDGLKDRGALEVEWFPDHPPAGIRGLVIANEVLDAMPVKRFVVRRGQPIEIGVCVNAEGFAWSELTSGNQTLALPANIAEQCAILPDGYISEYNAGLEPWLERLHRVLDCGVVLLNDYGYPSHEYLHPDRASGTLKCHFLQRVHSDPFWYPGTQDITAAVDFTAVAEAATAVGFTVAGYATQARFLLACGLQDFFTSAGGARQQYALAQQAKLLLLPSEMGQTCKFMALTRNFEARLSGFSHDERQRLAGYANFDQSA